MQNLRQEDMIELLHELGDVGAAVGRPFGGEGNPVVALGTLGFDILLLDEANFVLGNLLARTDAPVIKKHGASVFGYQPAFDDLS